jgi:pimeloyl-ACP methyl ester carboxylesterase
MQAMSASGGDGHKEVRLDQGTVRYRDTGEGEAIVFVHGYLVDGRLWSETAGALTAWRWIPGPTSLPRGSPT